MKATHLLKHNIDALLRARGQKRRDLAQWCRRSEAWLSKLFSDDNRNVPMKYFDRIADFFGIATYQLFQPGISPLTERRAGRERRSGMDRRLSQRDTAAPRHTPVIETVTPWERSVLTRLRVIAKDPEAKKSLEWMLDQGARAIVAPKTADADAPQENTPRPSVPARRTPQQRRA